MWNIGAYAFSHRFAKYKLDSFAYCIDRQSSDVPIILLDSKIYRFRCCKFILIVSSPICDTGNNIFVSFTCCSCFPKSYQKLMVFLSNNATCGRSLRFIVVFVLNLPTSKSILVYLFRMVLSVDCSSVCIHFVAGTRSEIRDQNHVKSMTTLSSILLILRNANQSNYLLCFFVCLTILNAIRKIYPKMTIKTSILIWAWTFCILNRKSSQILIRTQMPALCHREGANKRE